MVKLIIDYTRCDLCMDCVASCTGNILRVVNNKIVHDSVNCWYCETCLDVCENNAIILEDM